MSMNLSPLLVIRTLPTGDSQAVPAFSAFVPSVRILGASFMHVVKKYLELAGARGVAQLAQGLGFDLANALAGDGERLADFLQRVLRAVLQTKAHLDYLLFTRAQGVQHARGLFLHVHVDGGLGGPDHGAVFNQVAEVGIPLLVDWRLQRDRYLHNLERLAYLGRGNVHLLGNLFRLGFAAQHLDQLPRGANQLVGDLGHVYRDANGARLVGNGSADCLANPPRGVGGKLVAAAVLKLVHPLHQADVALLDQVEELQPAVAIRFGDGNHKAQVGFDELILGLLRVHLALDDFALRALQLLEPHAGIAFQSFQIGAMLSPCLAVIFLELFAARALNLLFQVADLAGERAHGVHGFIHPVDQAFALDVGETEVADDERNPNDLAA